MGNWWVKDVSKDRTAFRSVGPGFRTCVYCVEEKPASEFNREHVLPEAFGKFKGAPSRLRCVCKICNDFFAKELEPALTRDSPEALLRLECGQKPLEESGQLRRERFRLRAEEGPLAGMEVQVTPGTAGSIQPVPQVGLVDRATGQVVYLTEEDLLVDEKADPGRFDWAGKVTIVATTQGDTERLVRVLEARGVRILNAKGEAQRAGGGPVWVRKSHLIDTTIDRAVAKIAFNYLAHVGGSTFVARRDFDAARRFIRLREDPGWEVVTVQPTPVLFLDTATQRQTRGHLLASYWSADPGSRPVVWVSLYNEFTYKVKLADSPQGLWCEIERGYHFDIKRMQVERLIPMVVPGDRPGARGEPGWFLRTRSGEPITKTPWLSPVG